jgi:hypothetical protein
MASGSMPQPIRILREEVQSEESMDGFMVGSEGMYINSLASSAGSFMNRTPGLGRDGLGMSAIPSPTTTARPMLRSGKMSNLKLSDNSPPERFPPSPANALTKKASTPPVAAPVISGLARMQQLGAMDNMAASKKQEKKQPLSLPPNKPTSQDFDLHW